MRRHGRAPAARVDRRDFPRKAGGAHRRDGLRDQLDGDPGSGRPRGQRQGRPHHQRRTQPLVDRRGRARIGRQGAALCAQQHAAPGGDPALGDGARADQRPAVAQDHHRRRGHLLDGGRILPAARDCRSEEEVPRLPIPRRGALHWRRRPARPRRDRPPGHPDGRHRRDDGHVHQVLRLGGRLRGGVGGARRVAPPPLGRLSLRAVHVAARRAAGALGARAHHGVVDRPQHRRARREPHDAAAPQLERLPRGLAADGLPRPRRH
mmetsp:Transcript_53204/g.157344  ORF Transcript_53204/g.157344 Transcript_53204/m.157344 type:complete len:264 (+) Transcript_53204:695-1486(+)